MMRRSRAREVALQVLYQVEQNPGAPWAEIEQFILRRLLGDHRLAEFTEGLVAGVKKHRPEIDKLISQAAENWRLDRMAAIDRNILRLGAYEMLHRPEVPSRVAINEALELAKRYSTAQSSRFVNGILDRVLQSQSAAVDEASVAQITQLADDADRSDGAEEVLASEGMPELETELEPPSLTEEHHE